MAKKSCWVTFFLLNTIFFEQNYTFFDLFWYHANMTLSCQQPCGWLPATMFLAANNHVFGCGWLPTTMLLAANNYVVGCQQTMWLAASNHVVGCQQPRGWLPTSMWLAANIYVVGYQQPCGWLPITTMWLKKKPHVQAKQLLFLEYLRETFYGPSIHKKKVLKCSRMTVILHVSRYFHRFPEIFPCLCKSPALCPYKLIDHT